MNPKLLAYIHERRAVGETRDLITQALISNGWSAADIDAAFVSVESGSAMTVPVPPTVVAGTSKRKWIGLGLFLVAAVLIAVTPTSFSINKTINSFGQDSYSTNELLNQFDFRYVSPDGTRRIIVRGTNSSDSVVAVASDLPGMPQAAEKVVFENPNKLLVRTAYWIDNESLLIVAKRGQRLPYDNDPTKLSAEFFSWDYFVVPAAGGPPRLVGEMDVVGEGYSGPRVVFNADRSSFAALVGDGNSYQSHPDIGSVLIVDLATGKKRTLLFSGATDQLFGQLADTYLLGFTELSLLALTHTGGTFEPQDTFVSSTFAEYDEADKAQKTVVLNSAEVENKYGQLIEAYFKGTQGVVLKKVMIDDTDCVSPEGLDFYLTDSATNQVRVVHTVLDRPINLIFGFDSGCRYSLSIVGVNKEGADISKVLLLDSRDGPEYLIADLVSGKTSHISTPPETKFIFSFDLTQ